jgi:uncharacterized protein YcgI (DUF1989 family)
LYKLSHRRNESAGSKQQDNLYYIANRLQDGVTPRTVRKLLALFHRETNGFTHDVCLTKCQKSSLNIYEKCGFESKRREVSS